MEKLILAVILIGLVNAIVLNQKNGVFSFPEHAKKLKTAAWISLLVLLGTVVSSAVLSFVYEAVVIGWGIVKLKAVVYLLAAVCVGYLYAVYLQSQRPEVYVDFGKYIPLIVADISAVGVAQLYLQKSFALGRSIGAGLSAGVLFALILLAMTAARGKMNGEAKSAFLKGTPALVLYAALMAVALLGLKVLPI